MNFILGLGLNFILGLGLNLTLEACVKVTLIDKLKRISRLLKKMIMMNREKPIKI